jgi:hypothetical protein
MSVAATSAMTLDQCLREHRRNHPDLCGFAKHVQKQLAGVSEAPWQMATGEDLRWSRIAAGDASTDPGEAIMFRYMSHVMRATHVNSNVTEAFYQVMHMLEPPSLFFRPDIVLQVFATIPEGPVGVTSAMAQAT